jgi:hypothetical protein
MKSNQTRSSRTSISYSTTAATLGVLIWLLLNLLPAREASGQGFVALENRIATANSGRVPGLTTHVWGPSPTAPQLSLVGFGANDSTTRTPPATTIDFAATGMTMVGQPGGLGAATTFVQLIGVDAPTADLMPESSLVPVGLITTFRTQANVAGAIVPRTDTLTGNPAISAGGLYATFELVAWDNSSGLYPGWAQASAAWESGLIAAGMSGRFQVSAIGGGLGVPTNLNDMQDFNSFNLYYFAPEPSTLAFAGLGTAMLMIVRRRRWSELADGAPGQTMTASSSPKLASEISSPGSK